MENEVWSRVAEFLKELRCEDTNRNSYIELPEYKEALKEKSKYCSEYEKAVQNIEDIKRKKIQRYVDAVEVCAEEENQQAYLQGIIDGVLILSGMGLLTKNIRMKSIIEVLKQT